MNKDEWVENFDVAIVGSGAGGMAAAIVAAQKGLSVVVVEKTQWFGGTTAFSGGAIWIPNSDHSIKAGVHDSREQTEKYLDHTVGDMVSKELKDAFLNHGPEMVRFLEAHSTLRFTTRLEGPDYLSSLPGAAHGGRTLDTIEFDGRLLGGWFKYLRPPLQVLTLFGGMMVNRKDVDLLVDVMQKPSLKAFLHASKLLTRYAIDRLRFARGTRLVLGNALAGRLLKGAVDAGVVLICNAPARKLLTDEGRVKGLVVDHEGKERVINVRKGVVIATGGFGANLQMRQRFIPGPTGDWSMVPQGNTGDGISMAQTVGAQLGGPNLNNAFWTPVSIMEKENGDKVRWPHLRMDRPKPGLIAVNSAAKRFLNESASYHHFVESMIESHPVVPCIPTFLICDGQFLKRYGLGLVRPGGVGRQNFIDRGYLYEGSSLSELAVSLRLDPIAFQETIARYNVNASLGVDPEFGKGSTEFNRHYGDPAHKPNPCLRPLETPPYYAVKVYPGDIGTAHGIKVNSYAQALDSQNSPIEGLYVVGNDMSSVVSGNYPGAGITLGPAMTFGYIAALHMVGTSST